MDHNAIVEEIIRRVAEKISEAEGSCCSPSQAGKPGLLILTQDHGTTCHDMLESDALKARYQTDCALMHHYEVELSDYEAVVLFGLSCDAMCKLASGACDSAYTRLASKAILSGKKVYVPAEEVELYQFKETAPAAYYNMMQQKLDLLVASGVVVCAQQSLEQVILGNASPICAAAAKPACPCVEAAPAQTHGGERRIDKRVLTEQDMIEANMAGINCIRVGERCIITALAKDAAKDRGMTILKDEG